MFRILKNTDLVSSGVSQELPASVVTVRVDPSQCWSGHLPHHNEGIQQEVKVHGHQWEGTAWVGDINTGGV